MISHRLATADDRRFVVSAWSSSFKGSDTAGMIFSDDWARIMHEQIGRLLDRPGVRTHVAVDSDDRAFIYGFITADPAHPRPENAPIPVVFYLYVKEPYRRSGCARGLFRAAGIDPSGPFLYACKTSIVTILQPKIPLARWDPRVARLPKDKEPRR